MNREVTFTTVATFNIYSGKDVSSRYDVVKVASFIPGTYTDDLEFLVRRYDHTDWVAGRLFSSRPFDTMADAVAYCLANCGWGTFDLTLT